MDTRHNTSESRGGRRNFVFCENKEMGLRSVQSSVVTQTRQGCDLITQRHLNGRADSRTWIRPRDGVAGTRAYIKRLQLDQRRQETT